jgi:putative transcriptional regulator
MTINHHPNDELLLDYASGPLGEAWGLAIATHLALCPKCRRTVSEMEALGGSLLDTIAPEPVAGPAFDAVMARLEQTHGDAPKQPAAPKGNNSKPVLPQPLRGYVDGDIGSLPWQRLGLGVYQLPIATGDNGVAARLLRIPAGRPVPQHSHGGLELTLVLCGAFSDATGRYGRGDLQEADESLEHQPRAMPGEECICLAVTDAPLRFKSFAARLVQPFLDI